MSTCCVRAQVLSRVQPTLCNAMTCSLPGSSVHDVSIMCQYINDEMYLNTLMMKITNIHKASL